MAGLVGGFRSWTKAEAFQTHKPLKFKGDIEGEFHGFRFAADIQINRTPEMPHRGKCSRPPACIADFEALNGVCCGGPFGGRGRRRLSAPCITH